MKKLVIPAAAVIAALIAGPAPQSRADDQEGYLAYLRDHGISKSSSEWEGQTVAVGRLQCGEMRKGRSEYDVMYDLEKTMSDAEAQDIVYAAHKYLCPDAPSAPAGNHVPWR